MNIKSLAKITRQESGKAFSARGTFCLLGLIILCSGTAWSSATAQDSASQQGLPSVIIDNPTMNMPLGPYTIIQRDPNKQISVQSIERSMGANVTQKDPRYDKIINLGADGSSAWLAFKVTNNGTQTSWYLDVGRRSEGRLGHIKFFKAYTAPGTPDVVANPSLFTMREAMQISHKGLYNLYLPSKSDTLVFINVAASAGLPTLIPLTLYSEQGYIVYTQWHSISVMLYCLGIWLFAMYFLTLTYVRRSPSNLVFAGYFAMAGIIWLIYDTLGADAAPTYFGQILICLTFIHIVLGIFTTKIFCSVEYGSFTEKYILYGLIWLNFVATALSFFLPGSEGFLVSGLLIGCRIVTIAMMCLMAFAQMRSGQIPSSLYFTSWAFPLAGALVQMGALYGIIDTNAFTLNANWYSYLLQGLMLIFAMNEKVAAMDESERLNRTSRSETANLAKLKQSKDNSDHARLLKVIEKEREVLAEFREKEAIRLMEMTKAKEEADEANRAKSAFLAVVSHEIRTPMTGVMGMVKLLLDSNVSRQQRDYVMTIQESGEAMLSLLNDILDFEKIQRGKMELENISFDLHRLIQGVVTLMSGHAAQKKIGLSAKVDEKLPRFVKGDPTRLRQVLLNLMGNALKFTDNGSVTLNVKTLDPADQENGKANDKYMIYFSIQDTGIGIPPNAQKNLFSPFAQASSSIARKFGGSGLGLAISKGLVENMGSTLSISSREGEGSNFFFTLEMEKGIYATQNQEAMLPAATEDSTGKTSAPIEPLRILVVDDNAITRKVVIGFLEDGKHTIDTASSGEDALRIFESKDFDLVLMDIELPGIPGYEATKIIREHKDPRKAAVPVIALTGNTSKEDMENYIAHGMDGRLIKPINPDKLRLIIHDIGRKSYTREIKAPSVKDNTKTFEMQMDVVAKSLSLVPEGSEQAPPSPAAPPPEIRTDVFNPNMLQSLKDAIGKDQLNELLSDLIVKTDEILTAMIAATEQGDLPTLAARAHELKGMAGNFGLVEISAIAEKAERKAKGQEPEGLNQLVSTLPDASSRAKEALKTWTS